MKTRQRRQYEMLLRVRDFGNTYRELFSGSPGAQQTIAALGATIDDLTATDMAKLAASMSARADRKTAARKVLTDLLLRVSHLGKVLRARGRQTPPFEVPVSRSDQALLTAARQCARDAEPFADYFTTHSMPPAHIADVAATFEKAVRDRGMSRTDHTAARTRIGELIASAMLDVRRLEVIIGNELPDNKVVQAVWKQTRRIEEARGGRNAAAPPATSAQTAATPAVAPAATFAEAAPSAKATVAETEAKAKPEAA